VSDSIVVIYSRPPVVFIVGFRGDGIIDGADMCIIMDDRGEAHILKGPVVYYTVGAVLSAESGLKPPG
jgi:hypothetical protein